MHKHTRAYSHHLAYPVGFAPTVIQVLAFQAIQIGNRKNIAVHHSMPWRFKESSECHHNFHTRSATKSFGDLWQQKLIETPARGSFFTPLRLNKKSKFRSLRENILKCLRCCEVQCSIAFFGYTNIKSEMHFCWANLKA